LTVRVEKSQGAPHLCQLCFVLEQADQAASGSKSVHERQMFQFSSQHPSHIFDI